MLARLSSAILMPFQHPCIFRASVNIVTDSPPTPAQSSNAGILITLSLLAGRLLASTNGPRNRPRWKAIAFFSRIVSDWKSKSEWNWF
jgi:hypothetical protein